MIITVFLNVLHLEFKKEYTKIFTVPQHIYYTQMLFLRHFNTL